MENTNNRIFFVEDGNRDGAVCWSWFADPTAAKAAYKRGKERLKSPPFWADTGDYILWGTATVPDINTVAVLLNRGRHSEKCRVIETFIIEEGGK